MRRTLINSFNIKLKDRNRSKNRIEFIIRSPIWNFIDKIVKNKRESGCFDLFMSSFSFYLFIFTYKSIQDQNKWISL